MSSFLRDRPQLNVVGLGPSKAGKTTLAAALTQHMARRPDATRTRPRSVEQLVASTGARRGDAASQRIAPVVYETPARHVVHIDCPGLPLRYRTVPRALRYADAAVLVLAADVGVEPIALEHLLWARAAGVRSAVVFVNRCDLVRDLELLELVEREARQALADAGFDGDGVTVLRGSALAAQSGDPAWTPALDELADALDHGVPQPARDAAASFVAQVERAYRPRAERSGAWLQCASLLVRQGTVRRGDRLALRYRGTRPLLEVVDLEIEGAKVVQGSAGELVGALLRPVDLEPRAIVSRMLRGGPLLLGAQSPRLSTRLAVDLELLHERQGGRSTPLRTGAVVQLFLEGVSASARLVLPDASVPGVAPGGAYEDAQLELVYPVRAAVGDRVVLRDGCDGFAKRLGGARRWSGTAGTATVRRLLNEVE